MNQKTKSKICLCLSENVEFMMILHYRDRRRASEAADALGQALQNSYVCILNKTYPIHVYT